MSKTFTAVLTAAVLAATTASADVAVTISSEGYDDFFKRCDLEIETSGHDGDVSVIYRILAGEKGAAICQEVDGSSSCREADDLEYTCDDMSRLDVFDVTCLTDGNPVSCGSVSVSAGEGISLPIIPYPGLGIQPKGVNLYATVLGYDDFFEDCEMGFSYAGPASIEHVEVEYEVATAAGSTSCTTTLSGNSGTGRSCGGGVDFTCDQVTSVTINAVSCESGDAEVDCGPVTIGTFDDFFKDAR